MKVLQIQTTQHYLGPPQMIDLFYVTNKPFVAHTNVESPHL